VAVFGSVARGEAREGSDVNLLIVVEGLPEDVGSRLEEISRARWRLKLSSEYEDAKRREALATLQRSC